jgi:hypothetical protein
MILEWEEKSTLKTGNLIELTVTILLPLLVAKIAAANQQPATRLNRTIFILSPNRKRHSKR